MVLRSLSIEISHVSPVQGFEATLAKVHEREKARYEGQMANNTRITSVYRPYFDPICDVDTPVPAEVLRAGKQ